MASLTSIESKLKFNTLFCDWLKPVKRNLFIHNLVRCLLLICYDFKSLKKTLKTLSMSEIWTLTTYVFIKNANVCEWRNHHFLNKFKYDMDSFFLFVSGAASATALYPGYCDMHQRCTCTYRTELLAKFSPISFTVSSLSP